MNQTILSFDGAAQPDVSQHRSELDALRLAIDEVDDELVALLAKRVRLSQQAQAWKLQAGLPKFDRKREVAVIRRYHRLAHGSGSVAVAILRWCRGNNRHQWHA